MGPALAVTHASFARDGVSVELFTSSTTKMGDSPHPRDGKTSSHTLNWGGRTLTSRAPKRVSGCAARNGSRLPVANAEASRVLNAVFASRAFTADVLPLESLLDRAS